MSEVLATSQTGHRVTTKKGFAEKLKKRIAASKERAGLLKANDSFEFKEYLNELKTRVVNDRRLGISGGLCCEVETRLLRIILIPYMCNGTSFLLTKMGIAGHVHIVVASVCNLELRPSKLTRVL